MLEPLFDAIKNKENESLIHAVKTGNSEKLIMSLENGADINVRTSGDTLVMIAAESGNIDIAKILLEKGADVNAENHDGRTALMIALWKKHIEIAKLLLKNIVEPNAVWPHIKLENPLQMAIEIGNIELIELLLEKGFSINQEALNEAFEKENIEVINHYIKNGADLDSESGKKALEFMNSKVKDLFEAIYNGNYPDTERLIKAGVNINAFETGIWYCETTALIISTSCNSPYLVKILLENGANVNAQDENGITALFEAVEKNDDIGEELLELLLNNGADVNIRDLNAKTALMLASKQGNQKMVELMLEKAVTITHDNYNSSIISALKNSHEKIVKLFIEKGANIRNAEVKKAILENISEDDELGFLIRILKLEDYKRDNREMLEKLKIDDDLLDAVTKMTLPWSDNLKNIEMIVEEKRREI